MREFPASWVTASLESLISSDGQFSDGDWVESKDQDPKGVIRLLQLADVGDGVFLDKSVRFINEEKFAELRCTEVLECDVLVARMPAPLGRACLAPRLERRCITVVDVAIVRPGTGSVFPRWLMHFLNSPPTRAAIESHASGTTRSRISRSKLAVLELPVPPRSEQRRIADKLDALLSRVDACRERLDRVPDILERFRQAVLAAATSGELTREWREARGLPDEWPQTSLEVLCQSNRVITYGVIKLGAETKGGVPCLRTSNVRWLRIDQEGLKRISPALSAEFGRTVLQGGEVLVNVRGTLGGVAVAEEEMRGWNVSREVAVVPCDVRRVESKFLMLWIGADRSQRWLRKVERGVAYTGINIEDLRRLPVALPPKPEQMEIVRRVEILQAVVDRIELSLHNAVSRVEGLTGTVLAKAFRGELVPQDPNDEPAALLLERIRAAGNNQKISGRTKGTRGKAAQPRE